MTNIPDAIAKAETDLVAARAEIVDLKERLAGALQDEQNLESELEGLRSYAIRHGLVDGPDPAIKAAIDSGEVVPISANVSLKKPADDLLIMKRNPAVLEVLRRSTSSGMSRIEIQEQLAYSDREETLDEVSLALTGLKRQNQVRKMGRGRWALVEQLRPADQVVHRLGDH